MNDIETEGVYVHGSNNAEVQHFSPKWTCSGADGNIYFNPKSEADVFLLGISSSRSEMTGAWCNEPPTLKYYFICEVI